MIQVIVRAIDILEFVAKHGNEPVKLVKIAENSGLSQPTCANIVKTLVDKNYLENISRKEGYILGISAFSLTGSVSYKQSLVTASTDLMQELVKKINETCILGVLKNNKRIVLNEIQANNDLQVKTKAEAEIYPTASGRILMSFLPDKELDQLIEKIGLPEPAVWAGIKSKNELLSALRKIKNDQLVQTLTPQHIVGVAIPIFKKGQVIAALSAYLPESRYKPAHRDNIFKYMQRTANKIKDRLNKAES
ncbi:MAG: helix-turn-helix domain-containing protein [Ferruginibacter sp.]|nr:helix-turn-helix domain-containing protein [Ferruginibacter sp.]